MNNFKLAQSIGVVATALFSLIVFAACNKDRSDTIPTIEQTIVGLEDLSQLELATIKTDLVVTLSNKNTVSGSAGNFTFFAPTNKAFAKLGLALPQDLNSLQHGFLSNIIKYHISNGSTKDEMLTSESTLFSLLEGETIKKRIVIRGVDKYINGSKIIVGNAKADNGIVHVIDRVLLISDADIAQSTKAFAQGRGFVQPELNFLSEALNYCDLDGFLSDPSKSYTVFAPSNQAFTDLGKLLGVSLKQPSDVRKLEKANLSKILRTHIFTERGGRFTSEMYPGSHTALNGEKVAFGEYDNGVFSLKGSGNTTVANMLIPDIQTTNGVLHIIDRVILP